MARMVNGPLSDSRLGHPRMWLDPAVLGVVGHPPGGHLLGRVGTSSSACSEPGSIHRRAASVARITGIRSCTRMVALASVMISV